MNFNGSGGLMFLIIAGLWVWVFVPSWFKRSEDRKIQKEATNELRGEIKTVRSARTSSAISDLAQKNFKLKLTRRIFSVFAYLAFAAAIASIFAAVSQIFYWIVTLVFSAIFVSSFAIARSAKRKSLEVLASASKSRANVFASVANSLRYQDEKGLIAGIPVDTRSWQANRLPAPRQRIGELETPTLAEVVEIDDRVVKNPPVTLDSTALDEILRRRRANG